MSILCLEVRTDPSDPLAPWSCETNVYFIYFKKLLNNGKLFEKGLKSHTFLITFGPIFIHTNYIHIFLMNVTTTTTTTVLISKLIEGL
jgi:hypothetical protein